MNKLAVAIITSLLTGIMGHLAFFPLTEKWNNNRLRKIGRYAIGVVINTLPFIVWLRFLNNTEDKKSEANGAMAYMVSFLWTGVGTVAGYIIDDVMKGNE